MKRPIFSLALMSLSLCALAQPRPSAKSEEAAVQYVKNVLASRFDNRLPRISLEYFLAYETNGASAKWTVSECEKPSTGASVDPPRNSPICVRADFDLKSGDALTILISADQQFRRESVVRLTLTELTGNVRRIRSLGDLPMELHREPPGRPLKTPRDLPLPASDS